MKMLGFAIALALTNGAAQAGSVFEVPINGGIARIQLDDNCQQSVCASVSWTEIDGREDRKEPAKPSTRLEGAPAANVEPPVVLEPKTMAAISPSQPTGSTIKASQPSPVGEWLVEDGEARIRIEECGNNLCGVVSGVKNSNETDRKNPNPELRNRPIIGMPVLLDMKPTKSNRWEGQVYNAKNGQTYTANISLNDPQRLRVEGCVFGGLVCGGQNWTRVN
jgi:uncharacterized protein (DUF2147 family)